ncbi:hypothetical protein MCOR19_008553 [Pyricularia oryzae]|nr:hypothetical protein MCOR19_008553 [Pyricularia oryzae]KAI6486125.1 hypothetical protein MCOR18_003568 [Pyricularia oryzae]
MTGESEHIPLPTRPMKKRRTHRKSRHGCQECKQRHQKCDELRPQCANCAITNRACHYEGDRPSLRQLPFPGITVDTNVIPPPNQVPSEAVQQPRILVDLGGSPQSRFDGEDDTSAAASAVNMDHMELMAHYTFALSNPEIDQDFDRAATKMVLQAALDFPWLLHEVLAITSRQLVLARPERAAFYLAQASRLQTRALSLFNNRGGGGGLQPTIDAANALAATLFASMLGRHLLVDTLESLLQRTGDDVGGASSEAALDRFCHYLQVHNGLRVVASGAWPHLVESELWPLISLVGQLNTPRLSGQGNELRGLSDWVREQHHAKNLTGTASAAADSNGEEDEALKACLEAISLLQSGLDNSGLFSFSSSHHPLQQQRRRLHQHQMTFSWSVRCPAKFNQLVQQRRPVGLVILAHYAVLLHLSRDLWLIGRSASRFFRVVTDVLGPAYDAQLAWPREALSDGGNDPAGIGSSAVVSLP